MIGIGGLKRMLVMEPSENPPESSSENKPEVSVSSLVIHALTCDTRGCETTVGHLHLLMRKHKTQNKFR